MRQAAFRNLRAFVLISLFITAVVRAADSGEVQPENRPTASSHPDDEVKSTGSQNEASFQSYITGYLLVTDVLDGWGGESKSAGYDITINSGGQATVGSSESNNYGVKTGFISAVQIKRGDVNQSGLIDVGDVVYLINYLYQGGSKPMPLETGDSNCDGVIDVGDVIYLINYLFRQGLPPCDW